MKRNKAYPGVYYNLGGISWARPDSHPGLLLHKVWSTDDCHELSKGIEVFRHLHGK